MKPFRFAFSTRGLVWVWMSFTAVAVLWLLALLPTDVSILAPTMSFTAFLGHAHWGGLLADGERIVGLLILGMAAGLLALYSITRSAVGRLGVALGGILTPAILLSDKVSEFGLWFVRMPVEAVASTARALRGQGNGQFYVDGPFLFAAIGWWTVFCLALAFRETFLLLATRRAAEQSERRDNLPLCLLSCLLWIWAALHGWPPIFFSCTVLSVIGNRRGPKARTLSGPGFRSRAPHTKVLLGQL